MAPERGRKRFHENISWYRSRIEKVRIDRICKIMRTPHSIVNEIQTKQLIAYDMYLRPTYKGEKTTKTILVRATGKKKKKKSTLAKLLSGN